MYAGISSSWSFLSPGWLPTATTDNDFVSRYLLSSAELYQVLGLQASRPFWATDLGMMTDTWLSPRSWNLVKSSHTTYISASEGLSLLWWFQGLHHLVTHHLRTMAKSPSDIRTMKWLTHDCRQSTLWLRILFYTVSFHEDKYVSSLIKSGVEDS